MPTEDDQIRASDVIRELKEQHGRQPPATSRQIHTMILDGRIAATRGSNGRLWVARSTLPTIAEIIGMTSKSSTIAAYSPHCGSIAPTNSAIRNL
jgi:hypothetical protein